MLITVKYKLQKNKEFELVTVQIKADILKKENNGDWL